ncbi:MAG: hypothetical protein G8237_10625 [Magnetococcales bacterium]|nr:hypothetical protein [Magnetococcales bacterium]NGZ06799.1 hypothetical protein [Magnetococcales bacterium]
MNLASWWLSILLIMAVIGSVAGLVLGAWIFLNPDANALLDRPASEALRHLSRPVRIERFVYRHHRWFGGGIVIGSFCTLVALGGYVRRLMALAALGGPRTLDAWLWESLLLFVALGNFFTLTAGLLILIRPSGLKGFETWANRPVSLAEWRAALRTAFRNHPRLFALLLATGGFFSLVLLFRMILK